MTWADWLLIGVLLGWGSTGLVLHVIGSGPNYGTHKGFFARSLRSRLFGAREDREHRVWR